jgi:hypothetical protein
MSYQIIKETSGELSFGATVEIRRAWVSQIWARGNDLETVRRDGLAAIERARREPEIVETGELSLR